MRLRVKQTGRTIDVTKIDYLEDDKTITVRFNTEDGYTDYYDFESLKELNDTLEDYEPVEPIFDEKIRKAIRAWWDMQDNPFKSACVLLISKNKDLDGFYHWTIFGYIRNGEEKMSTKLEFRTKKLYAYKPHHDYKKEELCGE